MAEAASARAWPVPDGYLDAAAGQPMERAVLDAWLAAARDAWSDPAGLHDAGRRASMLLEAARSSLAASLTACAEGPSIRPEQVWLASSGASARDALLRGWPGPMVTSAVDTLPVLDQAECRPGSHIVPVLADGSVEAAAFAAACEQALASSPDAVACLQLANAEVGTRQPAIAGLLDQRMPWLADATQCIGRIGLDQGWSAIWASSRDWAGPPGLGIAVIRDTRRWRPPTGTTRGWLDGAPDVPSAVAAAIALESLVTRAQAEQARARELIDLLREQVPARVADVEVIGHRTSRLPHVLTFCVLYVSGEALVSELARRGFAVASGSACVAHEDRPSHVLAAMGAYTGGNVRISLPLGCAPATVHAFLDVLPAVVEQLRGEVGR